MNLNMKEMFDEALKEALPEFKKKAKEYFTKFFEKKLSAYFFDRQAIQRYKDNPSLARMLGVDVTDPDTGLADKMVNDFITENILEDEMKKFMRRYMDQQFGKHLTEAMDKAMKHKAHAIAFKEIRKVDGPHRAVVILQEVMKFLEDQGQALNSYTSATGTDFTEIRLPYAITSKLGNSFAIAFPKCEVSIEDNETSLKVYYDEHVNAQA